LINDPSAREVSLSLSFSLSRFFYLRGTSGERETERERERKRERKGGGRESELFRLPNDPSFWSAPTVIRVRHSRRLAFVPLSWYRPDTGDLDSLAEEIYPTFDSRSFVRSFVRSLARSVARSFVHPLGRLCVLSFVRSFATTKPPSPPSPRRRIDRGSPIITHVRTPQRSPRDRRRRRREHQGDDDEGTVHIGLEILNRGVVKLFRCCRRRLEFGIEPRASDRTRLLLLFFSWFATTRGDSARRVSPSFIFPFVLRHHNVWRIIRWGDLAVNGIIR